MKFLSLLLLKVVLTSSLRERKDFERIGEESRDSRNRQNRGFLPSRRYPVTNFDQSRSSYPHPAYARTTTYAKTYIDRFSFQSPFFPDQSSSVSIGRGSSEQSSIRERFRSIRNDRNTKYPRPSPRPRPTRRSNRRKQEIPKCTGSAKEHQCYKNIYLHSADSSSAANYFTVHKCRGKNAKRAAACQKGEKYYPLASPNQQATQRDAKGDDHTMVFEKVTLGEDKQKGVVKIGFLNIATNLWIYVREDGVVTLKSMPENRTKPRPQTEFYEHTTKRTNYDFYEYAGAKKSGRKRSRSKKSVFMAVTKKGDIILVEHPYKKVENPSKKKQRPDPFKEGDKTKRISTTWNKGVVWRPEKSKKTRETRRRANSKTRAHNSRRRNKDRAKGKDKDKEPDKIQRYGLYFLSTEADLEFVRSAFTEQFKNTERRNRGDRKSRKKNKSA